VPAYLAWIQFLSWFYYGFEVLAVNQWADITNISCSQKVRHQLEIYELKGTFS
jgi:hypothetical protein